MKLRKPCPHDRYERHAVLDGSYVSFDPDLFPLPEHDPLELCPGGVFLPDDTLIIQKQALILMGAERFYVVQVRDDGSYPMPLFDFLDAVREAE